MLKKVALITTLFGVLTACGDPSLLSKKERIQAQAGTHNGKPVYEFVNDWKKNAGASGLKDELLNKKAARFCPDFEVISREDLSTVKQRKVTRTVVVGSNTSSETVASSAPIFIEREKVRIVCGSE